MCVAKVVKAQKIANFLQNLCVFASFVDVKMLTREYDAKRIEVEKKKMTKNRLFFGFAIEKW